MNPTAITGPAPRATASTATTAPRALPSRAIPSRTASRDPRSARTMARLRLALLRECARHPLAEVTVSAVARRAGVGRATFYLHYDDLDALATDASVQVVRNAVAALYAGPRDGQAPPPPLVAFAESVHTSAVLYKQLIRPGGAGPLGELLHRELRARALIEARGTRVSAPEWAASAVAGTFTSLLADWLHGLVPADPAGFAAEAWRRLRAVRGGG